jgi:hypothetical protein
MDTQEKEDLFAAIGEYVRERVAEATAPLEKRIAALEASAASTKNFDDFLSAMRAGFQSDNRARKGRSFRASA